MKNETKKLIKHIKESIAEIDVLYEMTTEKRERTDEEFNMDLIRGVRMLNYKKTLYDLIRALNTI